MDLTEFIIGTVIIIIEMASFFSFDNNLMVDISSKPYYLG